MLTLLTCLVACTQRDSFKAARCVNKYKERDKERSSGSKEIWDVSESTHEVVVVAFRALICKHLAVEQRKIMWNDHQTETYLVNEKIRVLYYEEWEKKKREIFFFFFSFERFLVMDLEPKDYKSGAAMWERTKKVRASLLQYLTGQSLRELWFWFIVWKEEKCLRISEVDSIFSFFFFFSQIKRKLKMKFE